MGPIFVDEDPVFWGEKIAKGYQVSDTWPQKIWNSFFFPDLYMQNHQPLGSAMWSGHRSHRTSSAYPGLQLAKDGVPLGIRQQYLAVFLIFFFGQPFLANLVAIQTPAKFCQGRLHHTSLRTDGAKVHKLELC